MDIWDEETPSAPANATFKAKIRYVQLSLLITYGILWSA